MDTVPSRSSLRNRERGARDTRPCAHCGQSITRLLSNSKSEQWFCDRTCKRQSAEWDTRPCVVCGRSITRLLAHSKSEHWTCSAACRGQHVAAQRMAKTDSLAVTGKRCARCGEDKPREQFPPHPKWRDGLFPYCLPCKRAEQRAQYAKDRAKRSVEAKARYARNPAASKARARQRYRDKRELLIRQAVEWGTANPELRRVYRQKWARENPEYMREKVRQRYALRRGAFTISFTPEQLAAKVAYWGDRCWLCTGEWTAIDHVKPLSKGGPHILANLRPICQSCNSHKRNTWPWPLP